MSCLSLMLVLAMVGCGGGKGGGRGGGLVKTTTPASLGQNLSPASAKPIQGLDPAAVVSKEVPGASFLPLTGNTPVSSPTGVAPRLAGQTVLAYAEPVDPEHAAADAAKMGGVLTGVSPDGQFYTVSLSGSPPTGRFATHAPGPALSVPNVLMALQDDSQRQAQALSNIRQLTGYDRAEQMLRLNPPRAVKVALLDAGADLAHPALQGQVVNQVNLVDESGTADSHGTRLAMLISGKTTSQFGGGLCPDCQLLSVKVCAHGRCPLSSVLSGLEAASRWGAEVICLGFGARGVEQEAREALSLGLGRLKGAVVLAPSGNDSGPLAGRFPADVPGIAAVAASTTGGLPWSGSVLGSAPLLSAPGADLPLDGVVASGTSYAVAIAAGALGHLAGQANARQGLVALLAAPVRDQLLPVNLYDAHLRLQHAGTGSAAALSVQAPPRAGPGANVGLQLITPVSGPVSWKTDKGRVLPLENGSARLTLPTAIGPVQVTVQAGVVQTTVHIEVSSVTPTRLTLVAESPLATGGDTWATVLADTAEGYRLPVAARFEADTGAKLSVSADGHIRALKAPGGTVRAKTGNLNTTAFVAVSSALAVPLTLQAPGDWPVFKGSGSHVGVSTETIGPSLIARWKVDLGGPITASPIVESSVVYTATETGDVVALDKISGTEIWRRSFGGVLGATPTLCGALLIMPIPRKVVALNRGDGTTVWEFDTHVTNPGNPPENASSPVCDNVRVYFGSLDASVYAVNLADGSQAWELATGGQVPGSPALLGGLLAIGSTNNYLYYLDAATGVSVWNLGAFPASNGYNTGGNNISSPAISGTRIYMGVSSDQGAPAPYGEVIAVNQADGSLAWSFNTSNWVTVSPTIAGGLVLAGDIDFNFYALDENTGAVVWSRQLGSAILSSPIVVGNVVYVGTDDRQLYALNLADGQILSTFETGARIWSSVAPSQGILYLTSADRFIYALGAGITPPQSFTAADEPGQNRLNWTPSTTYLDGNPFVDIGGTDIYRSLSAGGPFALVGTVGPGIGTFVDTNVTADTTYFYEVLAFDTQTPPNESAFSSIAQATPSSVVDTKPPAAPTGLLATPQDSAVLLTWNSPATNDDGSPLSDLAGFLVYQSLTPGGPYTLVTPSPITATNYNVSLLTNGVPYYFVVTAVDDKAPRNESADSLEVSATPSVASGGACVVWRQFGCTSEKTGFINTILTPPLVPRWQYQTGAVVGSSPVAIAADTVFAGSEDSYAYALNLSNGAQRWRFKTGGIIQSAPVVGDDVVVYASADGFVYGLDRVNGTQIWRVSTGGPVFGPLVLDGSTVYAGDFSGFIYALDINTGQNRWAAPAQVNGSIIGGGAVSQGLLYIGSSSGRVNAYNTLNGALLWSSPSLNANITSTPSIDGDRLYVGTDQGALFALSLSNGVTLWQFATGGLITASPSVRNRVVYVGSWDGIFYAVNGDTGAEVGRFVVGDSILSTAAIANDIVFFGANDSFLYALDADDITVQLFRDSLQARVLSSPAITGNFLVLASDAGRVFAFSTGNKPNPPSGLSAVAGDKEVTLSWSAPILNTDGTPVTDLDSYNIYFAPTANGPYTIATNVSATTTSATVNNLLNTVPYFFQVTVVDNENPANESEKSNIATGLPSNKPPAVPQNFTALSGDKRVTLSWSAVTTNSDGTPIQDLAGYNVYFGTTPGGPYSLFNPTLITQTGTTVSGLTNGVTYYFVVRAQDSDSPAPAQSANSVELTATPLGNMPSPPQNLNALAGDGLVLLSWSTVVTNTDGTTIQDLAGYDVYVSLTSGGPYTKANTSTLAATSFTLSGLINNTPYFFVVRAKDRDTPQNQSDNSSEVTATPRGAAPAPPVILFATPQDTAVELTWEAPSADENGLPLNDLSGYNIYFTLTPGGPYTLANATPITGQSYTVTNLENLQTYYFVVRALDSSVPPVESINSNEVSAIPNVQDPVYLQGGWYQSDVQEAIPGRAAISLYTGAVAVLQKRVFDDVGVMLLPLSMYQDPGVVAFRVDGVDSGTLTLSGFKPDSPYVNTYWIAKGLTINNVFPETAATPNANLSVSVSASVSVFTVTPGNKQVVLQWPKQSDGDTFDIQRTLSAGKLYSKIANDFTGSTFIDRTVTNGNTYFYKVTATTEHRVEMRVLSGKVGFAGWEIVLQDSRRSYDSGALLP